MKKIDIGLLAPGMVLADDLIHRSTGVVLLYRGTILNANLVSFIHQVASTGYCLIEDPESRMAEELDTTGEVLPLRAIQQKSLLPRIVLPYSRGDDYSYLEFIDRESYRVYRDAVSAVEYLYQGAAQGSLDLAEAVSTANNLCLQVIKDPQVIVQLAVLKAFDNYTYTHAVNVAVYSAVLSRYCGWSMEQLKQITLAGLLHDIGKVDIPRSILLKPGKLQPEEWEIMKQHVEYSVNRVSTLDKVNDKILLAVSQHHERLNGSGYPQGLSGEQIHPWARILAIADIYDAVTTNRVYRKAVLPHIGAEILMSIPEELDLDLLITFIHNTPFYPLGTWVRLNNGEAGRVVQLYKGMPLRPVIEVVGEDRQKGRLVNLTEELSLQVADILPRR